MAVEHELGLLTNSGHLREIGPTSGQSWTRGSIARRGLESIHAFIWCDISTSGSANDDAGR
jgi:hypothetical protein